MSVLNRFSSEEINKLEETLKNNYFNFKITYNKTKKFYIICFDSCTRDFLYMFSKSLPYIYYQYSKQRLNKSGFDTTLIAVWPDLRERHINPEYQQYRRLHDPVFTGIRIPFNKSDNFLLTYKNALLDLLKDNGRELTPITFNITPILTFENIDPAVHFNFTSFVEYYREYWSELKEYLTRPEPLGRIDIYKGYLGAPGPLFVNRPQQFGARDWGYYEITDDPEEPQETVNHSLNEFTESNFNDFWNNNTVNFIDGTFDITYGSLGIEEITLKKEKEVNQNKNKTFKSEQCIICIIKQPNMLFCNCGHLCMCYTCFIAYNKKQCPVCTTDNTIIREI